MGRRLLKVSFGIRVANGHAAAAEGDATVFDGPPVPKDPMKLWIFT